MCESEAAEITVQCKGLALYSVGNTVVLAQEAASTRSV